jgi:release factor glutamine methyltransferase
LIQLDFLKEEEWSKLGKFDVIVSNPPYIKQPESGDMAKHVLAYEPHLALFVPDEDALLFYRKIAAFGNEYLNENGMIFLEINEQLGEEICRLYEQQGYKVELRKDMQVKDRMIKAVKA